MTNSRLTLSQIQAYISYVGTSSGVNFVYAGSSTALTSNWTGPGLLISWENAITEPEFAGNVIGMAHYWIFGGQIRQAAIALNYEWESTDANRWKSLVIHEVGHIIGLDHVDDVGQAMNPWVPWTTSGLYGSGDLAGLRLLGSAQGCLTGVSATSEQHVSVIEDRSSDL